MENQELIKQVTEKAEKWLTPAYDAETQAEVKRMLALTEDEEGNWDILYYSADMDKENTNNENMVLTLIPAAS